MEEMATWPAVRLAEAIRAKQVSSRELLELFLSRIEALDPPINAVVTIDVDSSRQAAAAADEATARGERTGPLHGLPITVKDAIETAGLRSTGGAVELAGHFPRTDAPAVGRLKSAGAIVFGKTNLPRWSFDVQCFNELFGTTNNPWAVDRTPGGSSGGAAAAVACGFTSFELGTDIGGSIRLPSHCCGVFGLKPSYGAVPQQGYLDHVGGGGTEADINVFGPMARSAQDLDLLLGVLAGPDPSRAAAWRLALPPPTVASLAACRVGVWFDDPDCAVDLACKAVFDGAAGRLVDAGARLDDSHPPVSFEAQNDLFIRLVSAATSPSLPDEVADEVSGSHRAWLRADEERQRLRAVWERWFTDHDILLCPVSASAAFAHNQAPDLMSRTVVINGESRSLVGASAWCGLIGVVGLPSVVVPVGMTPEGLPVGLQVVAPFLRDRQAIHVAGLIAEVVGGYRPPPGFTA